MSFEKKYLLYIGLKGFPFVGAVWLLFYRLYMTDASVGILDGLSFAVGMLAEIPSGVLADRIGRKKLAIFGSMLIGSAIIAQGLARSYFVILISQTLLTIGWALRSGADTALLYENHKSQTDKSLSWKMLLVRGGKLTIVTELFAFFIGGYIYVVNKRLPFIAWGILTLASGIVLFSMKEPKIASSENRFLHDLKDGIAQLWTKQCRQYIPIILVLQGLFYVFDYGLLRPVLQSRAGLGPISSAWVLLGCGVSAFALQTYLAKKYVLNSEGKFLTTIGIVISLLMAATSITTNAVVVIGLIAALYIGYYLVLPWVDDGLNAHVDPKHRATAISTASFLTGLPYVLLAPVIGILNSYGRLGYILGLYTACIGIAMYMYNRWSAQSSP